MKKPFIKNKITRDFINEVFEFFVMTFVLFVLLFSMCYVALN